MMKLRGALEAADLASRIEADSKLAPSERKLRIYDATVDFRRGDDGRPRAVPGHEAYESGHIPGARFVDHQAELSDGNSGYNYTLLPSDRLQVALRSIGIDNDSTVVVYSTSHLMWATRLWWILHSCGFEKAYVLDGGFPAWRDAGLPVSLEPAVYSAGDLDIDFSARRWAGKDEVEAAIEDGSVCTINALTEKMHNGTSSVHYGRPGHIPRSVNVPFEDLSSQSRFLPADLLKSRLDQVGAFEKKRVVTYCGGGIAATLAAFALAHLGHPDVGVYDGSLTEWSADASLPMTSED